MRAALLLVVVFACGKPDPIVELTPQQREEFCAQHPRHLGYSYCSPPTQTHCDFVSQFITCLELLDALPATCEATADDVAQCLDVMTCQEALHCDTICGVKLWSHSCCSCG